MKIYGRSEMVKKYQKQYEAEVIDVLKRIADYDIGITEEGEIFDQQTKLRLHRNKLICMLRRDYQGTLRGRMLNRLLNEVIDNIIKHTKANEEKQMVEYYDKFMD